MHGSRFPAASSSPRLVLGPCRIRACDDRGAGPGLARPPRPRRTCRARPGARGALRASERPPGHPRPGRGLAAPSCARPARRSAQGLDGRGLVGAEGRRMRFAVRWSLLGVVPIGVFPCAFGAFEAVGVLKWRPSKPQPRTCAAIRRKRRTTAAPCPATRPDPVSVRGRARSALAERRHFCSGASRGDALLPIRRRARAAWLRSARKAPIPTPAAWNCLLEHAFSCDGE